MGPGATGEAARLGVLAKRIVKRAAELHGEATDHSTVSREGLVHDARQHLDYLTAALRLDAPLLFRDYIAWAVQLNGARGVSSGDIRTALTHLERAIEEVAEDGGGAMELIRDVRGRIDAISLDPPSHIVPGSVHEDLARSYLEALLRTRRDEASEIITEAVDGGVQLRDVYLHVLAPVQREVGRLWQLNRITVAQEHYCTAVTQFVMSQLYPRVFGKDDLPNRTLVASSVSGDLHEIAVRMLADLFELEGWRTVYLGADTPTADLVESVAREKAHLLALSASLTPHVRHVGHTIEALREDPRTRSVPVLVGGRPFDVCPHLAQVVRADRYAPDPDAAIRFANGLEP